MDEISIEELEEIYERVEVKVKTSSDEVLDELTQESERGRTSGRRRLANTLFKPRDIIIKIGNSNNFIQLNNSVIGREDVIVRGDDVEQAFEDRKNELVENLVRARRASFEITKQERRDFFFNEIDRDRV
ncbi:MAG: hypothetical protein AABY22_28100, partial [Nanoarchaeota archaeon]